jgi:hypothetical protein
MTENSNAPAGNPLLLTVRIEVGTDRRSYVRGHGRQPRHLNLQVLRGRHDLLPRDWSEQRRVPASAAPGS